MGGISISMFLFTTVYKVYLWVTTESVTGYLSKVGGRLADDGDDAIEMSRVIANAVLKYKLSKSLSKVSGFDHTSTD